MGSLVRLYGNKSVKNAKEKKMEEHEITRLQTQAKFNSPNYAILNKLNEELEKLYQKRVSYCDVSQKIDGKKKQILIPFVGSLVGAYQKIYSWGVG